MYQEVWALHHEPTIPQTLLSLAMLAVTACGTSGTNQHRSMSDRDREAIRSVLIEARRLPEAIVQRVTKEEISIPSSSEMDEVRDSICDGETSPLIFYQLVVSANWHYYWLCSQKEPVRAMTPKGDRSLRRWLRRVERQAVSGGRKCPTGSSRQIFTEQHESGTRITAYCDGVVVLDFPDGGRRSFRLSDAGTAKDPARVPLASPQRPTTPPQQPTQDLPIQPIPPSPSKPMPPPSGGLVVPPRACPPCEKCRRCPKCPACAKPNPVKDCRKFGERAFWQGVRKACDKICPAIFRECSQQSPTEQLCHKLSAYCATLKGVCNR